MSTPATSPEPFVYRLKALAKVVDGDTVDLDLDLDRDLDFRYHLEFLVPFSTGYLDVADPELMHHRAKKA